MNQKIILECNSYMTQEVGKMRADIIERLDLTVKDPQIVLYPGAIKHMKRRHYRAYKYYFKKIPEIIQNPDYMGHSISEDECIEFVKKYNEYVLVAVKWNEKGQLFVSSMYMMDDDRIENKVIYGKLIGVPKISSKTHQKYKNNRSVKH